MFLSNKSKAFYDLGGISGLDHDGDSRAFGIIDYDRDGWPDIAMVNNNTPLLQLYRNRIGDGKNARVRSNMLAVRFVGGNQAAEESEQWSNRDGIGAKVLVALSDMTLKREYRAGEGLASQNSSTMLIGIGEAKKAASIKIIWPSGKTQEIKNVAAGKMLTAYENPAHSPNRKNFLEETYIKNASQKGKEYLSEENAAKILPFVAEKVDGGNAKLHLYTTMATWCVACKKENPQLRQIKKVFSDYEVAAFGVPVDEKEGVDLLNAYMKKNRPAYELLTHLSPEDIAAVKSTVVSDLKQEGLPATIITDSNGNILKTVWGVPSVSQLQELLGEVL